MGFDINWLVPERVLEVNASGTITEEALEKLNDALYDSMGDQPLHMIYDASGVEKPFLDLERQAERPGIGIERVASFARRLPQYAARGRGDASPAGVSRRRP